MRKKLTVEQQVEHMKSKGIAFNIIKEKDAMLYLENNNYYFKLKAYAKNYAKYEKGENKDKYVNLEFAYLKDLATIDMHLRHFVLRTATDIEHSLKVHFLCDFNKSPDDGYLLVSKFLTERPDVLEKIKIKKENSYTKDLIEKLLEEGFAIWNILELLSLKDFLNLYQRFFEEYPDSLSGHNLYYPMHAVKNIRNAAAHNNCIINSLRRPYTSSIRYNHLIDSFVAGIDTIGKKSRIKNKNNQVIYDFVTMLYLVDELITDSKMKTRIFKEAKDLFQVRMLKHSDYYSKESSITSAYCYVNKIVDFLYEKSI